MSITKQVVIDQITVTEFGVVLYREATRVFENGDLLMQKFARSSLEPGADLSAQPDQVRLVCEAVWTDQVVADFKAMQALPL